MIKGLLKPEFLTKSKGRSQRGSLFPRQSRFACHPSRSLRATHTRFCSHRPSPRLDKEWAVRDGGGERAERSGRIQSARVSEGAGRRRTGEITVVLADMTHRTHTWSLREDLSRAKSLPPWREQQQSKATADSPQSHPRLELHPVFAF